MFIGEYHYSIDDKNRLGVPVKFRTELLKGAVVTRGLDTCLFLFPRKEWTKLATKLSEMPISKSKSRTIARLMLAGAMDVSVDKQGRINLPDYLRKYAGIGKKAVVAGLYNRMEIWDEKKWETFKKDAEEDSSEIADTLGEIGV
ncbi:division/cell wall cluster transcriptional repressor MraZ [Patescibacteria group bacterium]|nr:division/cell wall cluster transcriptional repressor MraZ [Patescibacteria group bacterium]